MTGTVKILKQYPRASAYLLGAFDSSPFGMDDLLSDVKIKTLVHELDGLIKTNHPRWVLSEIYCRGLDLKEAADDEFETIPADDKEKIRKMKKVIDKIRHNDRIVLLACHIGHLVYEDK